MRKVLMVLVCSLAVGAAAYVSYAQADKQVDDKGYIDIGSYKETATKKRPSGSFYRGSGILTFVGKPPKPYLQHDMGGYELDPAPAADRNKPYNKHDLSHVWEFIAGSGGMGTRVPPMTDYGYKQFEKHIFASGPRGYLATTNQVNDPELICDPIGFPRIVYRTTRPFEFFQLPNVILYHGVWHETWRKIWMDGRLLPKAPIDPAWVGYTTGKWVGDTLVADTNGVDDRAWLDQGLYHSLSAEFQERWRRIDHNTLQFNLTTKDPEVFKETWNSPPSLFELYPSLELDILPCVPSEEDEYRNNTPTENPNAGEPVTKK